jgi:hypothetical protein
MSFRNVIDVIGNALDVIDDALDVIGVGIELHGNDIDVGARLRTCQPRFLAGKGDFIGLRAKARKILNRRRTWLDVAHMPRAWWAGGLREGERLRPTATPHRGNF